MIEKLKTGISEKSEILATKQDLAETKVDLIKWIVAFWITIVLLIVGLYLKK